MPFVDSSIPRQRAPQGAFIALVVLCSFCSNAMAQSTCENLSQDADYQAVVASGVEYIKAKQYDDALEAFSKAQRVCPFDPGVTYYMARAKHLAGACETAVILYDQAVAQLDIGLVVSDLTAPIITAKREAALACQHDDSLHSVLISCEDNDVTVIIGSRFPVPCPAEALLPRGRYPVVATRAGHIPYQGELLVGSSYRVVMDIPPLKLLGGTLVLSCLQPIENVELWGPGEKKLVSCPSTTPLPIGSWEAVARDGADPISVVIEAGEVSRALLPIAVTSDAP